MEKDFCMNMDRILLYAELNMLVCASTAFTIYARYFSFIIDEESHKIE